jgi:hypothetical protein
MESSADTATNISRVDVTSTMLASIDSDNETLRFDLLIILAQEHNTTILEWWTTLSATL